MLERRQDREIYFKEQDKTTSEFVVPYIAKYHAITPKSRVLEIGCGEGGNMKYFVNAGCEVVGIDLHQSQLDRAQVFLEKHCESTNNLKLICQNIYDTNPQEFGQFDVVMMRDVIEHIPNQEKFMSFLRQFMKEDGVCFFGFPPWYMPFGGHQQGCKSFLKKVPYFHILPKPLYKGMLQLFGESEGKIKSLLQTKSTGISIERFKKAAKKANWQIKDQTLYLFNPNYKTKFNINPKKQFAILGAIPFFRNFVTTCAYFIISPNNK